MQKNNELKKITYYKALQQKLTQAVKNHITYHHRYTVSSRILVIICEIRKL